MGREGVGVGQLCQIAEELELARLVQSDQPFEKEATEQPGQNLHRQEEPRATGDPSFAISRQPTPGYDDVHVRVVHHRRSPGVEN